MGGGGFSRSGIYLFNLSIERLIVFRGRRRREEVKWVGGAGLIDRSLCFKEGCEEIEKQDIHGRERSQRNSEREEALNPMDGSVAQFSFIATRSTPLLSSFQTFLSFSTFPVFSAKDMTCLIPKLISSRKVCVEQRGFRKREDGRVEGEGRGRGTEGGGSTNARDAFPPPTIRISRNSGRPSRSNEKRKEEKLLLLQESKRAGETRLEWRPGPAVFLWFSVRKKR